MTFICSGEKVTCSILIRLPFFFLRTYGPMHLEHRPSIFFEKQHPLRAEKMVLTSKPVKMNIIRMLQLCLVIRTVGQYSWTHLHNDTEVMKYPYIKICSWDDSF